MSAVLALALVLAGASVEAAQAAPAATDSSDLLAEGMAARRAGAYDRAATLLARHLDAHPNDSDALIEYGFTLLALDRRDAARDVLLRARALAPNNPDAAYGLALIAERANDGAAARAYLKDVPPGYADADALRQRVAGKVAHPLELDLDAGPVWVPNSADWQEASLGLTWRSARGQVAVGRIDHSRRFGRRDTYGELRLEQPTGPGSIVYLLGGATPDADFRARWQLGAGLRQRLSQGGSASIATFDLRHADYRSGRISSVNPGIEQYADGGRMWLVAQSINLRADGRWLHGGLIRLDRQLTPRLRAHVGGADAPEMSEGVASRTRSLFGGLRVESRDGLAWRATLTHDKPRHRPARNGLMLGVGLRL